MKRGQISIFIILGIIFIIFLIFAAYIYIKMAQEDLESESPGNDVGDITTMKVYITDCISILSKEAFQKIGEHGGYIDPHDTTYTKRPFSFNNMDPTESDAVPLIPGTDLPVVYWWYMSSENTCLDCVIDTCAPNITQVRTQVEYYVSHNLESCVLNSTPFIRHELTLEPQADPTTSVTIAANDVSVDVHYPVKVTGQDQHAELDDYNVRLDLPFSEVFDLATKIMYLEAIGQFMEYGSFTVISTYAGLGDGQLPPIAAIDHSPAKKIWALEQIRQDIDQILASNMPLIQFNRTIGAHPYDASGPYQEKILQSLFFNQINVSYPNIRVQPYYLSWPYYLDITPRRNSMIKPHVYVQEFPFDILPKMYTNYYEFFYDISFPIIFELREITAYKQEGYSFYLALETNIRDNKDLYDWYQGNGTIGRFSSPFSASAAQYGVEYTNCTKPGSDQWKCPVNQHIYSDEFECKSECHSELKVINRTGLSTTKSLICDENQRLSGNVTVKTLDAMTKQPVDDVYITFGCGTYHTCDMGRTTLIDYNIKAVLQSRFPLCIGGFIMARKEGYEPKTIPLDTSFRADDYVEVELSPLIEINATVKIKDVLDPQAQLCCGPAHDPDQDMRFLISIEKIKHSNIDPDIGTTYMVDGTDTVSMLLSPGEYHLEISGIYSNETTIAASSGEYSSMPETTLSDLQTAKALFTDDAGLLTISDEIYTKHNMTFYAISLPIPTTYSELDYLSTLDNYSLMYRSQIEPSFS